jgi:hypothetical protein
MESASRSLSASGPHLPAAACDSTSAEREKWGTRRLGRGHRRGGDTCHDSVAVGEPAVENSAGRTACDAERDGRRFQVAIAKHPHAHAGLAPVRAAGGAPPERFRAHRLKAAA